MKPIILAGILSTLSLAAFAQSTEQSTVDTQSVTVGAVSPKYDVSKGTRIMTAEEFGNFTGSYDLSNGKSLSLFTRGQKKYAVIDGEARHELVATRANSFVSVDNQLKMTIVRDDNGDAKGELLIAGPAQVAQAIPHTKSAQVAQAVTHKKHARRMVS
jgi:hypothetical protein